MKLTGEHLSVFDVFAVAVQREEIELSAEQLEAIQQVHERVQTWGEEKHPIYGVNTGFGELVHMLIPPQYKTDLQVNLLRSHAAGGGEPFPDDIVRAIMTVRLNYFTKGYSGISARGVYLLQQFLNRQIHPVVPQQGSLGASGDLAPLSQMALPLIGDGFVRVKGEVRASREVLQEEQLEPLHMGYKEALTLVNGTSAMTGVASVALVKAQHLLKVALLATADVVQCLQGSTRPFDHRGHFLKNHAGQVIVARELRTLLQGSQLTREHKDIMKTLSEKSTDTERVAETRVYLQDAYSLRCVPQILGPVRDAMTLVQKVVEEEINSCNDNPLIFDTPEELFHGGNFHGQYVAMYSDFLNIALTEIGVLAERQLNRLVDPHLNNSLPPFLAYTQAGLFSGFEGGQYLATSIASENLDLAAPSSVKSIPSNGGNQDVVSMGLNAARKSLQLCENVTTILAVLVSACYQASHFLQQDEFSPALQQWHHFIGSAVALYRDEFPISQHIARVRDLLVSDQAVSLLEKLVQLGE